MSHKPMGYVGRPKECHKPMGYVGRPKECHTNPWDMLGGQRNVTQTHGICWEAKGMSHKPMGYVGRPKECYTNPWDMLWGATRISNRPLGYVGVPRKSHTEICLVATGISHRPLRYVGGYKNLTQTPGICWGAREYHTDSLSRYIHH